MGPNCLLLVWQQVEGAASVFTTPPVSSLRILESAHPSPKVRATQRAQWEAIPGLWAEAAFD